MMWNVDIDSEAIAREYILYPDKMAGAFTDVV